MAKRLNIWLKVLLVGLLALATVPVPGAHARSMVVAADFAAAYAMPDGTLPELCGGHGDLPDGAAGTGPGHGGHHRLADCLGCIALGPLALPGRAAALPVRRLVPVAPVPRVGVLVGGRQVAADSWHARAPPAFPLA